MMRPGRAAALTALVLAPCFLFAYARLPALYDTDAYYHLAVARLYGTHGFVNTLDWARFSIMRDGFGDKDFLFHVLLMPFATLGDASHGGVIALALLDALVAAALTYAAVAALGARGMVVPFLVFGTAADFTLRMARLRPELLALLLILAAISAAAAGRTILLAAIGFVFALSYTAFHALLGLCALFFVVELWARRRADWGLLAYPAVGVGLGLLAHPGFPANLRVWVVQNFDFFAHNATHDLGTEITSRTTRDTLLLNLAWWMGLVLLWRSRGDGAPARPRLRDFTLVATAAFGVLYTLMARFITYLVPLLTLAVVRAMAPDGGPVRLPWRGRVPFGLAMAACLMCAFPTLYVAHQRMVASSARTLRPDIRADWEAFARALPSGAKVAAPWAATQAFVFWAPQGVYLNVLDPVFMAARDPDAYQTYIELFEGREPDIPLLAASRLDSDYLADDGQYPYARARLANDPRAITLHEGATFLYRLDGRNDDFILDWKMLPPDAPLPAPLALVTDPATPSYPRADSDRARAREGYVDLRRVRGIEGPCTTFARAERFERPEHVLLEVSPYGNTDIFVDDRLAATSSSRSAMLGRGIFLPIDFEAGVRVLTIRTCRTDAYGGFYALVRRRMPA